MQQEQAGIEHTLVGRRAETPPTADSAVRLFLLGGFRLLVGGAAVPASAWRLRKARSLIKLLALAPNRQVGREQVMDALWPDLAPAAADNNLRGALHAARRALAPLGTIVNRDGTLTLAAEGEFWIDVVAFEEACIAARRSGALADYAAALDRYTGELLPEDRYEDWASGRRDYLHGLFLGLLRDLAAQHERAGDWTAAITATQRLLVAEPVDEAAHIALMRLHALAGQRALALAQWEQLVATLRRELDAEPEVAARALRDEIAAGRFSPVASAPAPDIGRSRHNLPIPMTALIGREADLAAVKGLLADHRLITLTGSGGCGKTRLSLAVATDLLAAYPDGVWFVDLAALTAAAQVPGAVAATLGVREVAGTPLATTLTARLASGTSLLILDNCEHLRDACADLAAALLAACPALRFLATSRIALGLAEEVVWRIPSLRVPREGGETRRPADLAAVPAVRLFVERVRGRRPTFVLTAENSRAVAAIVRRLDGIPLALELAAARVAMLSVEQLAPRLDDALRLLTGGSRAAAPRQQTLRATLEWSYRLLDPPQRTLLARLSVCAGGCDLDAVEAVCADAAALPRPAILDELTALAEHSLVQVEADDRVVRYRLLETVRQFASERLRASGEEVATRQRHAACFAALAESAASHLAGGPRQAMWIARLAIDHDNLRAALAWTLEHDDDARGLRFARALGWFWFVRGHLTEGRQVLERALARGPAADPALRAWALLHLGGLALVQLDHARAVPVLEEALSLCRARGDARGEAFALFCLGHIARDAGNVPRAMELLEASLAISQGRGEAWGIVRFMPLNILGAMLVGRGDHARAKVLLEEMLALGRYLEDKVAIANALMMFGWLIAEMGDRDQAVPLIEEALVLHRELGHRLGILAALVHLGWVALLRHDHDQAIARFTEGLIIASEARAMPRIVGCLRGLGLAAAGQGRQTRAARIFGAAMVHWPVVDLPQPTMLALYERAVAAGRKAVGEAAWAVAWAAGEALNLDEAVAAGLDQGALPTGRRAAP